MGRDGQTPARRLRSGWLISPEALKMIQEILESPQILVLSLRYNRIQSPAADATGRVKALQ